MSKRTMSDKLRHLAKSVWVMNWTESDCEAYGEAEKWLLLYGSRDRESFDTLTDDEWSMFMYFVAEAVQTPERDALQLKEE